ncbi:MAG: NAD(P)H-hydrate dehydratase [Lachnospiraceae bacterium]|nr:NAD(P)H-hydrate dehydratase [Lachnospiraceae bacterium]
MIPVLTSKQMADADRYTQEELGLKQCVLMERAALSAYSVIDERADMKTLRILIVCGPGNNGGDGLALARIMRERDIYPDVLLLSDKMSQGELEQLELLNKIYPEIRVIKELPSGSYDLIIDAMFGISLNRPIEGIYEKAVDYINNCHRMGAMVIALDIASGVDATDGSLKGSAVMADITVSFGTFKAGHMLYPGALYSGEVILKDIGIPSSVMDSRADIRIFHDSEIKLPARSPYTNKGSYGKILVIAGSNGMAGAAILCAEAALRSGSGMVRIYTDESNRQIIQTALPEAIVSTYSGKMEKSELDEAFGWCDTVAIGPGLSRSESAKEIVRYTIENAGVPIVIDADALNIIASDADILANSSADVIITPHVGEMSRLTGVPVKEITRHLISTARDFSKSYGVITVLKDAHTIVSSAKGEIIININGNNGMATAGSGDVLTGIIASVRGRDIDSFTSAALGCAVHGRAGDAAKNEMGADHMIAGDIIKYIR